MTVKKTTFANSIVTQLENDAIFAIGDCAAAPCMSGCPAEQDIPRYLDAVARGDFELAWRVITATNPFPNVQGMACNHQCQSRCTRINYDKPLMIREVKRFVAEKMAEAASGVPAAQTGKRAAVIGAGPAGLSCARFLAAQGVEVHLYEEKPVLGGMAGDAIPAFRLTGDSLRRDIDACGYFPDLIAETIALAIAGEPVLHHVVHHEATFARDEIQRHLSVLVLTATRLIVEFPQAFRQMLFQRSIFPDARLPAVRIRPVLWDSVVRPRRLPEKQSLRSFCS